MKQIVKSSIPIYLFPGIAADFPVFERIIPLLKNPSFVVSYPNPLPNETLSHFAARISPKVPSDCIVVGASFGGVVANEVAHTVGARACFLIGSVRGPHQLPPWLRIWRCFGRSRIDTLLLLTGSLAAAVPHSVRNNSTARATCLSGASGVWYRWAMSAILNWQPSPNDAGTTIQIHGDADSTFPLRYVTPDVIVRGGKHALAFSHPQDVVNVIEAYIDRAA